MATVIRNLWKGRRVRVAGVLDQVSVESPDELAAIYADYHQLVYRRCYATLKDHEAALDATQDVFLSALACFEDIRHDIVRGLLDLARTLAYERRRRPAREVPHPAPPLPGDADDPAEIAERNDVLGAVWSALSPVERRYVADKFAGFSFKEIAVRNRRALGTVSSNLARAREHACRTREPMLPAAIGLVGWRRLTDLGRRLRSAVHDSSVSMAAQPVQSLTLSMALAGLITVGGPAPGAVAGAPDAPTHAPLVAPGVGGHRAGWEGDAAAPASSAAPRVSGTHVVAAREPAPATGGAVAHAASLPVTSPDAETPEDTTMVAAAPSPDYAQDGTILALGIGHSCACRVVLRSSDGGATWQSRAGAPDGDEIVLPPAYPRDARIFVGYADDTSGPSRLDYWTPGFGEPFRPLALPAGSLALSAGFDSGDPRAISSTPSGIWSLNVETQVTRPLVIDPSLAGSPAVATPLGDVSTGLLALTSASAYAPESPSTSIGGGSGLKLWSCPAGRPCSVTATVPLTVGARLSTSPTFVADHTLLAFSAAQLLRSPDAGTSFQAVALPSGASNVDLAALGYSAGGGIPMWMLVQRTQGFALEFTPSAMAPWREVDDSLPQITSRVGHIVPIGPHRVIYLSAETGFVCTADDGLSWSTRCPSA
jgi:DNA-directed RNA polymerase specialized sigma24 family protein